MELPLNISIIAPRGTGKTTLIGALYDYAISEIKNSKGFRFEVPKEYQDKLNMISQSLKKFRENLKPSYGTNEIQKFAFRYIIDGNNINVHFMDVPGSFTKNAQFGGYGNQGYNAFERHLHTSPVLLIPIDTPCLMEGELKQQLASLDVRNIGTLIEEWAQFREKSKKRSVLHFVMLKSESYAYPNRMEEVFEAFTKLYKEWIFNIWSICRQRLEINYTPVEIYGNIHLDKANSAWNDDNQYCEQFKKVAPVSKTKGISDLWATIEEFVEETLEESYLKR